MRFLVEREGAKFIQPTMQVGKSGDGSGELEFRRLKLPFSATYVETSGAYAGEDWKQKQSGEPPKWEKKNPNAKSKKANGKGDVRDKGHEQASAVEKVSTAPADSAAATDTVGDNVTESKEADS